MRFTDGGEGTFGANAGLPDVALGLLEPITKKYVDAGVISNADLWTLAANVGIKEMGGPKIPTRFGRRDAASSAESVESQVGRLPDGDKGTDHLEEIFYPKGFDDKDIVALSGAHTVGSCHADRSGFDGAWTEDKLKFDNSYFKEMISKKGKYVEETLSNGNMQMKDEKSGTIMLVSDLALLDKQAMRAAVIDFALDQGTFFKAFTKAWVKLQENGAEKDLVAVETDFNLASLPEKKCAPVAPEFTPSALKVQLSRLERILKAKAAEAKALESALSETNAKLEVKSLHPRTERNKYCIPVICLCVCV